MAKTVQSRLARIERDLLRNKPLRDCLRQCVSLGGDLRSARLRDWAMKELMGYQEGDQIPPYRTVAPALLGDAQTFRHRMTNMPIPWTMLPAAIRHDVKDALELFDGVAMLEENIRGAERRGDATVRMSLPMGADVGRLMSNDDIYFERIYWGVATSVFRGVLDEVRTAAVAVLADVRSGTPSTGVVPTGVGEVADQAVNVVVYGGRRHTINVIANQNSSSDASAATASDRPTVTLARPARRRFGWLVLCALSIAVVAGGLHWLW